jgi:predicted restriction endonuclease
MLTNYIESFKKIRTDINRTRWLENTKYRAPYKPLLLLTIFDLISQGEIKNNLIELTPEFCETFILYWSRIMPSAGKEILQCPFSI